MSETIPNGFPTVRILGSEVHMASIPEIVSVMDRWITERDGRCRQILVSGFHGLWEAHNNREFRTISRSAFSRSA